MTAPLRPGSRTVVDVDQVVLRGVPAGRERIAVAALEHALQRYADPRVGRPDGATAPRRAERRDDDAGRARAVGERAAGRIWDRIEAGR